MKIIRFDSIHGQGDVDCPDLGGEYRKWKHGEEKQLPDNIAEIALTNPNFVEVSTSDSYSDITIPELDNEE